MGKPGVYREIVSKDNELSLTVYTQRLNIYDPISPIQVYLILKKNGVLLKQQNLYNLDMVSDLNLPCIRWIYKEDEILMKQKEGTSFCKDTLEIGEPK
jgi:hypothetical protein